MTTDILDRYKKMQGKFKLPHLNELQETFKFDVETEDQLFDHIRTEMSDRLFTFTEKIIEPIIAGSDSFCCMYEQDMITNSERARLFELYKKMQVLKWKNNLLVVQPNDRETARWINHAWNLWNEELENELTQLCKKLSESWESLNIKKEKAHYFG